MQRRTTRSQALAAAGAVGLGALLSACGDGGGAGVASAEVETTAGNVATVAPQTVHGGTAAALFDGAASCTVTPEQTEGPYYFDVDAIRSDIREDRDGVRLRLLVRVQDADGCTPVPNAVVDVWHCDAGGVYSGFESASTAAGGGEAPVGTAGAAPGGAPPPASDGAPAGGSSRTDEATYLRGAQVTNADGIAEFVTVYPGWYRGRTVHVHTKVHLDRSTLLTTQLYFDEAVTARVYATGPYAARTGRDTFNGDDGILASGGGSAPVITPTADGDGWLGLVTLGVAAA